MQIAGFDILAELGRGGMGEVLLARRIGVHGFEKLVAIKTIRSEALTNTNSRLAFLDEARLLARLHHPAIAQVHDLGEVDRVPYIVMEYVAGAPFHRVKQGPWPPAVAAHAISEVCRGLHAAHSLTGLDGQPLNVVHRDVKPHNLLLSYGGSVKIIDFGIALMHDRETPETQTGTLKGSLLYMSPEQLYCEPVDFRSDIFSTGVILYELLTGERPYAGTNPLALAKSIGTTKPKPPSHLAPGVSPLLDAAVLQAIDAKAAARFASAKAMSLALKQVVTDAEAADLETFVSQHLGEARATNQEWLRVLLERHRTTPLEPVAAEAELPSLSGEPVLLTRETQSVPPGTDAATVARPPPAQATLSAAAALPAAAASPAKRRLAWIRTLAFVVGACALLVIAVFTLGRQAIANWTSPPPPAAVAEPARPEPALLAQRVVAAMKLKGIELGDSAELDALLNRLAKALATNDPDRVEGLSAQALTLVAELEPPPPAPPGASPDKQGKHAKPRPPGGPAPGSAGGVADLFEAAEAESVDSLFAEEAEEDAPETVEEVFEEAGEGDIGDLFEAPKKKKRRKEKQEDLDSLFE